MNESTDEAMKKIYKGRTETKLREVMMHVEEMYAEKDTLTTTIEFGAESPSRMPIVHAANEKWENRNLG